MRALSNLFDWMLFHGPLKPRHARAKAHEWIRSANQCECGRERVQGPDGHMRCPLGHGSTQPRAIVADSQTLADVPTMTLSERPLHFEAGPAHEAVDYRRELEKDNPFPEWLNSARKAWAASVEHPAITELSPGQQTEERPALKAVHWLRHEARKAEQLYGQLPQNKPGA